MSLIHEILKTRLTTESVVDDSQIEVTPEKREETAAPVESTENNTAAAAEPQIETPEVVETPESGVENAESAAQEPTEVEPATNTEAETDSATEPAAEVAAETPAENVEPIVDPQTEDDDQEFESDVETEAELAEKADEVAGYATAEQSLEEIAEDLNATLQDGGLTPEAVAVAQGSVNDILEDVNEDTLGLPSMESFSTFVGRRENTRLALESITEKAKELGVKAVAALRELIAKLIASFKALRARFSKANVVIKESETLVKNYTEKVAAAETSPAKPDATTKQVFSANGSSMRYVPGNFWKTIGIDPSGEKVVVTDIIKRYEQFQSTIKAMLEWAKVTATHKQGMTPAVNDYCNHDTFATFDSAGEEATDAILEVHSKADYQRLLQLLKQATERRDEYCDLATNLLQALDKVLASDYSSQEVADGARRLGYVVKRYISFTDALAVIVKRIGE